MYNTHTYGKNTNKKSETTQDMRYHQQQQHTNNYDNNTHNSRVVQQTRRRECRLRSIGNMKHPPTFLQPTPPPPLSEVVAKKKDLQETREDMGGFAHTQLIRKQVNWFRNTEFGFAICSIVDNFSIACLIKKN